VSERLSELLRRAPIPMHDGAESEAFRVVRAAFAEVEPVSRPRRYARRIVLALALIAFVAAALSPPGMAVLESIREAVAPERVEQSQPRLLRLPGGGRLLVDTDAGPWIVQADGSKRLLGEYDSASWSPHGLFVGTTQRSELRAVTPQGVVRWTLPLRAVVRNPRWSPSGFRVAYFAGHELHVVVGNGTDDQVVTRGDPDVAPAWRPGDGHVLALPKVRGVARILDLNTGKTRQRFLPGPKPIQLAWSADGEKLYGLQRDAVSINSGDLVQRRLLGAGTAVAFALEPEGDRVAVVTRLPKEDRSRLLLMYANGRVREIFAGAGTFSGVSWSPDGEWLLLEWKSADQWLFIRAGGVQEIKAVSNISEQFAGRPGVAPGFPEIRGWCCSDLPP
jgi:dipeptidyl aminopeptidase/acylaminoacyl peptidase